MTIEATVLDTAFLQGLESMADALAAEPLQEFVAVTSPEGGMTVAIRRI